MGVTDSLRWHVFGPKFRIRTVNLANALETLSCRFLLVASF